MIFNPMETLYGEKGISLKNLLSKSAIRNSLLPLYVPQVETIDGQPFLKREETVYESANEGEVIRFFWFDKSGKNLTLKEQTYIQINPNMSGFLVRMHCPITNVTETGLVIDYIVDTDSIKFHSDTIMSLQNNQVIENTVFIFDSYRMSEEDESKKPNFDPILIDFDRKRKEIIETYFS